ncbi:MAG: enoyl-CoA hydratase/isomerase family protein [Anaerolineales bacterium]|nr:enoyl-CoA hydratase/isomerase family protein [Chloroflexota bacterium]MBL6981029.1 enoyl-CoA hydratase/isomerase family protein [Anaerolineales bacterium]
MPVTLQQIEEGISALIVSRPQVRNALDWQAMDDFAAAVKRAHDDKSLRALIVTGEGDVFIAGGDLKALHGSSTVEDGWLLSRKMTNALNHLEALPCPVIAAINGPARGGGGEIALACDLRVVAADANLGFVQVTLGLIPGWGGGQRLLRLVGYSRALELLLTGRILNAQEMLAIGLANQVAPAGEAYLQAVELARTIGANPPEAVMANKRLLRAGITMSSTTAAAHEQSEFPALWASDAHQQAVKNWFQRRNVKP